MSIEPISAPRARGAAATARATAKNSNGKAENAKTAKQRGAPATSFSRRTLNNHERRLEEELLAHHPQADTEVVRKAWQFAVEAHGTQKRASGEPYVSHPLAVARILADLGLDQDAIVSALLHDIPEDTDYSLTDIEDRFGPRWANSSTV